MHPQLLPAHVDKLVVLEVLSLVHLLRVVQLLLHDLPGLAEDGGHAVGSEHAVEVGSGKRGKAWGTMKKKFLTFDIMKTFQNP